MCFVLGAWGGGSFSLSPTAAVVVDWIHFFQSYEESYPETGYEGYENYYTQQPAAA